MDVKTSKRIKIVKIYKLQKQLNIYIYIYIYDNSVTFKRNNSSLQLWKSIKWFQYCKIIFQKLIC